MAEHDIHDQRLEKTLDAMLQDYSDEQPRPGLETRVLATLRAEAEKQEAHARPWRWAWSAGAALAVAGAVAAIYIGRLRPLPEPPAIAVVQAPPVIPSRVTPETPRRKSIARRNPDRMQGKLLAASPRQEVFPTPAPLSEQEKFLLRYLAGTPREEVAAQSHGDDATPEDGGLPLPQSREFKGMEVFSTR